MFLSLQKVEDLLLGVSLSMPTSNYQEMVQLYLLNGQITFGHLQEEILKSITVNQLIPLFERQDLVHLLKLGHSWQVTSPIPKKLFGLIALNLWGYQLQLKPIHYL